jgi:hypothetical protein
MAYKSPAQRLWWAREELNLRPLPCQQTTGNRCADGCFCRSRSTVGAKVKCSLFVQLSVLFRTPRSRSCRPHHSALCTPVTRSTPPSTCTSAHNQCYFSTHQHSRTNPAPAHLTFRSPIALLSYHLNPTHESSAPGRGLMPGGAGSCQWSRRSGPRRRCRHRGAVMAGRAPQSP